MNKEKTYKEILNKSISLDGINSIIDKTTKHVILSHQNPDADAIGSMYAMFEFLLKRRKAVRAFIPGRIGSNLGFLNYGDVITSFDENLHAKVIEDADVIFVLDLNSIKRIADISDSYQSSKAKKILIDHHLEPEDFCDYYYYDIDVSATGVLIYDLIKSNPQIQLSKEIANALYTAIMTDTGSFRFPKTDAQTHRLIAELIDAGAEPFYSYDMVYNQFPISSLMLKSRAYSKIEIYLGGKMCLTTLTRQDFLDTNAKEEESESLVESLLSVKGIYFSALLIESPERDEIRCSLRAKNGYEVRKLAVSLGGGGHSQAAGARVTGKTLEETKQEILDYIKQNY